MVTKRQDILDAALRHLNDHGPHTLSLDVVAQSAQVSKGGLLYHFRTKEALLEGLLDHYLAHMDVRIAAHLAQLPPGTPWLHGYVLAQLEDVDDDAAQASAALLVLAEMPALAAQVRGHYAGWRARAQADAPAHADLILVALEGLWLTQAFGTMPLDAAARARLRDQLFALLPPGPERIHRW